MSLSLIVVYLIALLLFLILMLSLGFQPRIMSKITGSLLIIACVLGTVFYGYGYYTLSGSIPMAAARTLFSVFCMFLGRNEISSIASAPLFASPAMMIILYITHLMAFYCTASAVIATIGQRLIRTLNLLLTRNGNLSLIYGVNDDTVSLAQNLPGKTKIIFIDTGNGAPLDQKILKMGALMLADEDAKNGSPGLLKRIGMRPGKRHISIYCIDNDPSANLKFAISLKDSLEQFGIEPSQTSLTVVLPDEAVSANLQASGGTYGYGGVIAYEKAELISRLMIHAFPPCDTIRFDGKGRADENFEVLIVGFGKTGQAVLRSLIMNGQFAGSRFHATVVSKDQKQQAGSFFNRYPSLCEQYDIEFIDADARSIELYDKIVQTGPALNYVVICIDKEKESGEIAVEFSRLFDDLGIHALIIQCLPGCIRKNADSRGPAKNVSVFTPEILADEILDAAAMQINCGYHGGDSASAKELWANCDYFSRMSCRASADFLGAFLRAADVDASDTKEEAFHFSPEVLENLACTEHLRWCAFHYAMGYRPMSDETWNERAKKYIEQKNAGEEPLRIGKDPIHRQHACLIGWEELDMLSKKENDITGGNVDYKQMDRDNVNMLLRIKEGMK